MAISIAFLKNRLSRLLTDEDFDFWTDQFLFETLNEAHLAIARMDRSGNTQRVTINAVDGSLQSLPDSVLQLVSVDSNGLDGRTVSKGSVEMLDNLDACWRGADKVGYAEFWADNDAIKNEFWVYPPLAAGDPLTVVYVAKPKRLAVNAANIDLDAEYEQDLINFCLYRAYQREGTHSHKEAFYRSAFYESLGFKLQADLVANQELRAGVNNGG